jgi:bla regulator protein blaR1
VSEIFNHLWQSTLFAAAVALACFALRRNSPRLRYWLWLAASLKFLLPFAAIVAVGARVQFPPDTPSLHAVTVQRISTYFAPVSVFPAAAPRGQVSSVRATLRWPLVPGAIWLAGAMFLSFRWRRRWRTIHGAARTATRLAFGCAVPTLASSTTMEPGVFGIFRPVILLPEGIADNLTPEQLEAILAHELRHVGYRDNLTAALHMCVETLFWFHPVIWWIGAKLMDERERDCDEAVLRRGSRPGDYARGIVHVCDSYVQSPLPCASGIGGSDLKRRIREIMTWRGSMPMTFRGKAVLAAATVAAMATPFLLGAIRAQTLPPAPAYGYDVVSIHRSDPAPTGAQLGPGPQGGWRSKNTPVIMLLTVAYDISDYQVLSAPAWVYSDCYDVMFTPDKAQAPPGRGAALKDQRAYRSRNQQRLQAVLRDRFGLVVRVETRELPIYVLRQAKSGSRLSLHAEGTPELIQVHAGSLVGGKVTIDILAKMLSGEFHRPVHDETGLTGEYDFKLDWTPDPDASADAAPAGLSSPTIGSIFGAIDQLGLRLESKRGPVQVYVVEKIERPTEN